MEIGCWTHKVSPQGDSGDPDLHVGSLAPELTIFLYSSSYDLKMGLCLPIKKKKKSSIVSMLCYFSFSLYNGHLFILFLKGGYFITFKK